jgi:predicted CopG family antitoxin
MLGAMLKIEKASISQFLDRWIKRKRIKLALNIGN